MSKSLGNMIRIRDTLREYAPADLRYYFASIHYRDTVSISDLALKQARNHLKALQKNYNNFHFLQPGTDASKAERMNFLRRAESEFTRHMDDDFNTARALRVITDFARKLSLLARIGRGIDQKSKDEIDQRFRRMADVFGILS
jgi:cysteinyl-tRNA synthetase